MKSQWKLTRSTDRGGTTGSRLKQHSKRTEGEVGIVEQESIGVSEHVDDGKEHGDGIHCSAATPAAVVAL